MIQVLKQLFPFWYIPSDSYIAQHPERLPDFRLETWRWSLVIFSWMVFCTVLTALALIIIIKNFITSLAEGLIT